MKNDNDQENVALREIDNEGKTKKTPALLIALAALFLLGIMVYQALNNPLAKQKEEEEYSTGAINVPPPRSDPLPKTKKPKAQEEQEDMSGKIIIDQKTLDELNKKYAELQKMEEILAKMEAERKRLEELKQKKAAEALQKRRSASPVNFTNGSVSSNVAKKSSIDKQVKEVKPEKTINQSNRLTTFTSDKAKKMQDLNYLMLQGTKIPAVLEVAIHSELNSLLTAITTEDIYSADGNTLLIPKRSKLFGSSKRVDKVGQTRVFIVWHRVMTSNGISINIESPNADQIGRSGQGGMLDTHFFKRFGGALLLSMIDTGFDSINKGDRNVNVNTGGGKSVIDEVIKDNINIPPTVYVHNGTKINIIANKDISFKEVLN